MVRKGETISRAEYAAITGTARVKAGHQAGLQALGRNFRGEQQALSELAAAVVATGANKIICQQLGRGLAKLVTRSSGWLIYQPQVMQQLLSGRPALVGHLQENFSYQPAGAAVMLIKSLRVKISNRELEKWLNKIQKLHLSITALPQRRLGYLRIADQPTTNQQQIDALLARRFRFYGQTLQHHAVIKNSQRELTAAIVRLATSGFDGIIIQVGRSIALDSNWQLTAIRQAGYRVINRGVPIRPGNHTIIAYNQQQQWLLLVPRTIVSRSPQAFDIIFPRLLLAQRINPAELVQFATRGLVVTSGKIQQHDQLTRWLRSDNWTGNSTTSSQPSDKTLATRQKEQTVNVTLLLMAAGDSRRLGQNKLLLSYQQLRPELGQQQDMTLLQGMIAKLQSAYRFNDFRVVIPGSDQTLTAMLMEDTSIALTRTAAGLDQPRSLFHSLQAGLQAVSRNSEFVCICLADLPWLQPATIQAVIAAGIAANADQEKNHSGIIVRPFYHQQPGHPLLLPRALVRKLQTIATAAAFTRVVRQHTRPLPVTDAGVGRDIDTPADLISPGIS